ncbi:MAG: hypothetical protein B7Z23_03755 [Pseudomonadales bacterium 32-61-5]|nr:MAG: hypothetical protein B7Z23_03755 [Pseudomonadales bacterium 32-61-5]
MSTARSTKVGGARASGLRVLGVGFVVLNLRAKPENVSSRFLKLSIPVLGLLVLSWSFWSSQGWLQLCAGLALFLFGMQCLEEGLRELAGGKLEALLGRSTSTPGKALLFGIGGTMLLQSTTLVSLLTIAFISTGLIQLAGGIAVLFGANLGASFGIWLLALAGQNISLSPLALPLLVFGVLAGFNGPKSRAAGRIVLGIAFIFLGIDGIKEGFDAFGAGMDLTEYRADGLSGQLLFVAVGAVLTMVLQSSHATLMLTLAALASGQVDLAQSLTAGEALAAVMLKHVVIDHQIIAGRKLSTAGTFTYHFLVEDGLLSEGLLGEYGYTTPRLFNLTRVLRDAGYLSDDGVTSDGEAFLEQHQPL